MFEEALHIFPGLRALLPQHSPSPRLGRVMVVLQLALARSLGTDCHRFSIPPASPQLHLPGEAAGQAGPLPPVLGLGLLSYSSRPELCDVNVQHPWGGQG